MQLGELQANLPRFERRAATVAAISVDEPDDSATLRKERRWSLAVVADPKLEVIRGFGVEDPDVEELALHAVYIVDEQGEVFYRKVARRRPYSRELIDAIDHRYGSRIDDAPIEAEQTGRVPFSVSALDALLAAREGKDAPEQLRAEAESLRGVVVEALRQHDWDPAIVAWRQFVHAHPQVPTERLTALGRHFAYAAFLADSGELRAVAGELAQLGAEERRTTGRDLLASLSKADAAAVDGIRVAVTTFDEIARVAGDRARDPAPAG